MIFTGRHMQFPNRTLLPKSPFFKGGLSKQFLVVPPFAKGGLGGIMNVPITEKTYRLLPLLLK